MGHNLGKLQKISAITNTNMGAIALIYFFDKVVIFIPL